MRAEIEPAADLNRLREVYLIAPTPSVGPLAPPSLAAAARATAPNAGAAGAPSAPAASVAKPEVEGPAP
ncbi:hypothetical protein HC761_01355 [bacterium]|nr:hypothetical protein [bacterium]